MVGIFLGSTAIPRIRMGQGRPVEIFKGSTYIYPPFSINSSGLRHRAYISASGTSIADSGSVGGNWTVLSAANRTDGPCESTISPFFLGDSYDLSAAADLTRARPTWMSTTQSCTFTFWSRVAPATPAARIMTCFEGAAGSNRKGHRIDVSGFAGFNTAAFGDGTNTRNYAINTIPDLRDGRWHHFAVAFTGVTACTMYVDGVAHPHTGVSGSATTVSVSAGTWTTNAADWNSATTSAWGDICDLRCYDRVLTAAEVDAISRLAA